MGKFEEQFKAIHKTLLDMVSDHMPCAHEEMPRRAEAMGFSNASGALNVASTHIGQQIGTFYGYGLSREDVYRIYDLVLAGDYTSRRHLARQTLEVISLPAPPKDNATAGEWLARLEAEAGIAEACIAAFQVALDHPGARSNMTGDERQAAIIGIIVMLVQLIYHAGDKTDIKPGFNGL